MQYSHIFSIAALVSTAVALPAPGSITFNGADPSAFYTKSIILDNVDRPTENSLSISSITSDTINVKEQCTLNTVDFPPELVEGPANTWVVGPPQTITSISCGPPEDTPQSPPANIFVEFQGPDPASGEEYRADITLDGRNIELHIPHVIWTFESLYTGLAVNCTFEYLEGSATLVALAEDVARAEAKWAVDPPRTITSVSCYDDSIL